VIEQVLHAIDRAVIAERLAEARRAHRLTQQDVADKLGVPRTTIVAIEKGTRRLQAGELVKLAALFGRPVGEFLDPEPSTVTLDSADRSRHSQQVRSQHELDREQDIRQFKQLCRWYVELEGLSGSSSERRYPAPYDIVDTPPDRAALDVATAERNRLGLGDGPIGDLWELLDRDVGLRVFAFPLRDRRAAAMFLHTEELGGCIAVSANHPVDRRRWSAVHEYGHFLTQRNQPDVVVLTATRQVKAGEQFADAFARHFLLPAAGLTRRFEAIRRAKETPFTPGDLILLANHFGVSAQAMTRRLEELRLLPLGTWDRLTDIGGRQSEASRLGGPSVEREGSPRLPSRYELLAVQAFLAGELSEGQLAERLLTDRVGAREIVSGISTVDLLTDNGSWTPITLDLSQPLVASS
jgi:Zn-dependent peptidase ImmA (M78 family)/transcriptional regulator with XRE-family HTH domain